MQKVENAERDPRVALALSSTANRSRHFEVRGVVIETTTSGAEEHIEALARRYLGGPHPRYGGPGQQRLLLRVSPRTIRVMG